MTTPKHIILETSRTCNLRCAGCPISSDTQTGPAVFMDPSFFRSVIDRIDFPTTVVPWMNGEPLLHPEYPQLVKYVTDRNLRMYITTNGHFWNDELFDHICSGTSCYQLIFSLDGLPGSPSIRGARPGSNPDLVIENINRFLSLWNSTGRKLDVAVKIVQRGQDWEEIENYVLYWLDRGVSYVCEGRMLEEETSVSMRRYPCQYYDNNFMVIRHDGELVLCSYNDRVVNGGENPLFKLDMERPLLDAYNDPAYVKYRTLQNGGVYAGPCKTCGFAYTGAGMTGEVSFRRAPQTRIFYSRDYYNSFYSLTRKHKPASYYERGSEAASLLAPDVSPSLKTGIGNTQVVNDA